MPIITSGKQNLLKLNVKSAQNHNMTTTICGVKSHILINKFKILDIITIIQLLT